MSDQIKRIIYGYSSSMTVMVSAVVGVAEQLQRGALSTTALAERCGIAPEAAERFFFALQELDVLQLRERVWHVTEQGQTLVPGHPSGNWEVAIMCLRMGWPSWSRLEGALKTGDQSELGEQIFAKIANDTELTNIFHRMMSSNTARYAKEVSEVVAAEQPEGRWLDVGGGAGILAAAICLSHPKLTVDVLDLPYVQSFHQQTVESSALQSRSRFLAGSFFEPIPGRYETLILSRVLHDWPDNRAHQILEHVAMHLEQTSGRVYVFERLVECDHEGQRSLGIEDLNLWLGCGGRERTRAEFESLFEGAGLSIVNQSEIGKGRVLFELRR